MFHCHHCGKEVDKRYGLYLLRLRSNPSINCETLYYHKFCFESIVGSIDILLKECMKINDVDMYKPYAILYDGVADLNQFIINEPDFIKLFGKTFNEFIKGI